jgi:regulator of protease activity HflC (stomatin/prohibitin superfamily)
MDLFLRWRILDPAKAVLAVADVTSALRRVAAATACSIVGAMALGDALTQRASVGRDLREELRKVAETWGVGVTGVEIREVRRAAASSTL